MSGLAVTHAITEFDQSTPILFGSCAAFEADRQAALTAGAQAFFPKVTDFDLLLAEVDRLIDSQTERS